MGSYEETLHWLFALEAAKGMDFKLERIALALEQLGNPHRSFASIHVAGTNGKGSVAAMVQSVLGAAGYRVGLYTSPHLVRFTERIRIGEEEISAEEVVKLTSEIQNVATSRGIGLTFFEFTTVMAFVHFARRGVDAAVVEVGLGGRLDATNVLQPLVSVITTIGLDHTEWLGTSIEAVAAEKGGIIKPECPVVLGDVVGVAANVLRSIAAARGAPVVAARSMAQLMDEGTLDTRGSRWNLSGLTVGLRGRHQQRNAATALACLDTVAEQLPVSEEAVRAGFASVHWPGRLDIVAARPLTILDGAHNPDAVAELVRELPALLAGRKMHLLFSVMRDKEWKSMVKLLAPLCTSALVTEVLPPRSLPCNVAAEAFREACPAEGEALPERAWARILERADADDAIVVAGSLFLVGAVTPLAGTFESYLVPPDAAGGLQP